AGQGQVPVDPSVLAQQPAFDGCKVRIMPDAHAGAGCVIGFTADLREKVVPNLVGVDIGCGMLCVKVKRFDSLEMFDCNAKAVPSGFNVHEQTREHEGWMFDDVRDIGLLCLDELRNVERLTLSMGTLGGGNHFIEVDEDEEGGWYIVIHTGSRNLGLQVANIYQRIAEETCKGGVPKGLEYLTGELAEAYLHDMRICQKWAVRNRDMIFNRLIGHNLYEGEKWAHPYMCIEEDGFTTAHNYIGDDGIIRKGAISAKEGEKVLIPLNMRDGSIIGIGKGNPDWNNSAPHGAGRVMSRGEARRRLDVDEFKRQMEGIYTTTANAETIDEAPDAYKPASAILAALKPTVEVVHRLRPVYNFKAAENRRRR
ncbi:RtcB family protein, partial [Gordonibacter sp.]|uniref:RtcB family protein n=1 Tax=Gordonibacter sp. TaxID=1968902 RepID=UPI002FC9C74A